MHPPTSQSMVGPMRRSGLEPVTSTTCVTTPLEKKVIAPIAGYDDPPNGGLAAWLQVVAFFLLLKSRQVSPRSNCHSLLFFRYTLTSFAAVPSLAFVKHTTTSESLNHPRTSCDSVAFNLSSSSSPAPSQGLPIILATSGSHHHRLIDLRRRSVRNGWLGGGGIVYCKQVLHY